MTGRDGEAGVILVNVLVVLAIAAGLLVVMLDTQDRALSRGRLGANVAQAEALALGAEASVRTALRRDMTDAAREDHLNEPWATALQEEVTLDTGRFRVAVRDANAKFDINRLSERRIEDARAFLRIGAAAGLDEAAATAVAARIVTGGPIRSLSDLAGSGVPARDIAALRPLVDALSGEERVNLNTVGEAALSALLNNPIAAARLVRIRTSAGRIDPADLERVGVVQPVGTGFTSDLWDIDVAAQVDDAEVRMVSRVRRIRGVGANAVVAVRRRRGPDVGERPDPPAGLGDGSVR